MLAILLALQPAFVVATTTMLHMVMIILFYVEKRGIILP